LTQPWANKSKNTTQRDDTILFKTNSLYIFADYSKIPIYYGKIRFSNGDDMASTGVVLAYGCMSEVRVFRYTTFNQ